MTRSEGFVLALSGGIGGAKLALGLSRILPHGALTVVANTGDDFEHLGLAISPDIDTLLYTLAGLDNPELGWGRRDETWTFMAALERLGGETWFNLGDGDLATHVERTRRLAAGETLSRITDDFRHSLGISAQLLPMTDDRVRTRLRTAEGWLDFQDYFVRLHCAPVVSEIAFAGVEDAQPQPAFLTALADKNLRAVVICPSNPFISIDPITSLPGVREALRTCAAPIVAVSPIIGGKAVKGPTAKMMAELGLPVDATAVARHYGDILDLYVADEMDANEVGDLGVPVTFAQTLMSSLEDREALARVVLGAAGRGF
ncbi:MAG TPA: 2-phospho-L-lactate transferase [Stellaceae bacterium]|jgi:LPPG:FO 2-phospho-L-lactate transferase|nr:2-phospho-L-lactate transferase [Stellaceae bacterium]